MRRLSSPEDGLRRRSSPFLHTARVPPPSATAAASELNGSVGDINSSAAREVNGCVLSAQSPPRVFSDMPGQRSAMDTDSKNLLTSFIYI